MPALIVSQVISSAFGFSMIYVIFEDKADIYWARTRVLERLNYAASLLPSGVVRPGKARQFWPAPLMLPADRCDYVRPQGERHRRSTPGAAPETA